MEANDDNPLGVNVNPSCENLNFWGLMLTPVVCPLAEQFRIEKDIDIESIWTDIDIDIDFCQ